MTDPTPFDAPRSTKLGAELSDEQGRVLVGLVALRDLAAGRSPGAGRNVRQSPVRDRQGTLGVIRNAGKDEPVTLFTLGPGDLVGEIGFIDGSGALRVAGRARPHARPRPRARALESLLHSHPEIVYHVMRAIVRTVHQIQRRLSLQAVELSNYIYKQHGRY